MIKNIIVCSDGTSNKFGKHNTNVVQLVEAVAKIDKPDKHGNVQKVFYDPGVGTFGLKITGKITGFGISKNIRDAYKYLMDEYEEGSNIYLFGFSRGAYTIRSLAGMIYQIGLLPRGSENLIKYAQNIYYEKGNSEITLQFKKSFSRDIDVYFVGVWDTVKALNPFSKRHHDHTLNQKIKYGYHALAIDDKRWPFHPKLWSHKKKEPGQEIEQVWFAGMHSDVGGSYPEDDLSNITLQWMLDKAKSTGMILSPNYKPRPSNPHGKMNNSRKGLSWLYPKKNRLLKDKGIETISIHKSVMDRKGNPKNDYDPKNFPSLDEIKIVSNPGYSIK